MTRRGILGGLFVAALLLGACGEDDDDTTATTAETTTTLPGTSATVAATTTTTAGLTTAAAVADKLSAAGLGCSDRQSQTPKPAQGYPLQLELMNCTVSGKKAGIAVYAQDSETQASLNATQTALCQQIGKTATEKLAVAYGPRYIVGVDDSDPAVAAQVAQATGGQVKRFTCA